MYRIAIRSVPKRIVSPSTVCRNSNRFLSTAPPAKKSRSWKSGAVRWGIAGAGIYYYNTSNIFAEEPEAAIKKLDESIHHVQDSSLPTVDAVVEERRRRQAEKLAEEERKRQSAEKAVTEEAGGDDEGAAEEGGMGGLEEEADQQGAFNPETGEINWDCPCLGGMADGPCGPQFKEAFSCFVYSKEEPKGVECIEKFKGMQDCFRQHPEMYGSELGDDEDEVEEELRSRDGTSGDGASQDHAQKTEDTSGVTTSESKQNPSTASPKTASITKHDEEAHRDSSSTTAKQAQTAGDEGGELIPRAAHDATSK